MNKLDTLIFDVGNVLVSFHFISIMQYMGIDRTPAARIRDVIISREIWRLLDENRMDNKTAKEEVIRALPEYQAQIEFFFDNWGSYLRPYPQNIQVLKRAAHAGYRTYYLSNFHKLAWERMRNEQDFLDSTEGGVVSWQEYVSKPGEEIFRILIERYAIDPGRAVFIDDTLENVETASRLGFQCINYEDGQDLEAELRKMGILL